MNELVAKNSKQLDICLKLLYAEHIEFSVRVCETKSKKILYVVNVVSAENKAASIKEKYRILIS